MVSVCHDVSVLMLCRQALEERCAVLSAEAEGKKAAEDRCVMHALYVARHTSHVTRHTSHLTRHTLHVTRHTSHLTRHTYSSCSLLETALRHFAAQQSAVGASSRSLKDLEEENSVLKKVKSSAHRTAVPVCRLLFVAY